MTECVCPHLNIGGDVSEQRNWDPNCPQHGLESEWYRSPEQTAKREADNQRLRALFELARKRRNQARGEYAWTSEDQAELDAITKEHR